MVTIRDSFADPSVVSNDGRSFPLSDSREGASSGTRRRVDVSASSHRDRVACVNDSTAISWFHCLSARSRATRGRSRRWGRETTPHREGEKIAPLGAREPGIERGIERAAGVARRTPAPRPPLCVDRVRLPINIRSSSRVNRFESSHRGVAVESTNSPRVPLNFFSSPSPLDARARAVCRLFFFAGFPFVPFVRSVRIAVGGLPRSSCRPPPLPPPRFPPRLASVSSPGRARCRDIGIFIRSFGWTRCSVLRVMTRECTRAQTTTSYDSRYMECTPGYIRWRSSRRLESRRRRRTDDARDRGRDDETFPSPGDGDDRTTSPSVRVIQPSSRVCLDSFSFRALANRMNDRPTTSRRKRGAPLSRLDPRSSASSASSASSRRRRRRRRWCSRRRPHRTERDASTRSRSNRPFESSRIVPTPPLLIVVLGLFFSFHECVMHTAHAESSAKVDEREREREGARAKTRARARWTYFRVTSSLFLTRTRRRTVASVRRRVLGDRAATRQWFTIVRRGAFGGDDTRFIRGSIGGVERWEEFSFVRLPRRGVERYPKTRRRFRASSHRDRVACVNDSTAISSFHCLSARSRATRGRSRRWGRRRPRTGKERKSPARARNRGSSGNRARRGRRAANARTAPTALRRPRAFADQHPFVVARQSIRIIPSRSRGRVDQLARVPLNFFSHRHRRSTRARAVCRLFSRAFRSSRSFVPSASPSVVFPVPRVVLSPLPPPRFPPRLASFSSPGRARCRDIGIFIRSFGWTRCSVLRVMTRECTRAQTTTSYDSRYMECTPRYIRWRSSRRRESRRRRRTDDARDRGRDKETFPSPGDGDDRTTSPSVRVIQPSSRVCLVRFRFAPSPTE